MLSDRGQKTPLKVKKRNAAATASPKKIQFVFHQPEKKVFSCI